jgi:hypothetical protein
VRRLQDPPADKGVLGEPDPAAQPGHLVRGGEPPAMRLLDLGARGGPAGEVAHDLGVGVQLGFELEVLVRQRYESESFGVQRRLGHTSIVADAATSIR